MGSRINESFNPIVRIQLNPCLSSADISRGVEDMRFGTSVSGAKTAISLPNSNVNYKTQSGHGKRPTSRGERRQQNSNFNLSTGMTYMQYKDIKRKRPIWPWILFGLVLVALLSRVFPDNNAIPVSAPTLSLNIAAAPTITASKTTQNPNTMLTNSPLPARYVTPSPTISPTATPALVLGRGMRNDSVKALQEKLIELGYLKDGQADGVFGRGTEKAVEAFQSKNNLYSDGVAGEKTLTLLYSGNAKKKD